MYRVRHDVFKICPTDAPGSPQNDHREPFRFYEWGPILSFRKAFLGKDRDSKKGKIGTPKRERWGKIGTPKRERQGIIIREVLG